MDTGSTGDIGNTGDARAFADLLQPDGQDLLAELAGRADTELDGPGLIGLIDALRTRYPQPLIATALTQTRLRRRGRAKFGAAAGTMYFTADGLEQATRPLVAAHRAARFTGAGAQEVLDLCCGIGGDLLAFTAAGLRARGVDADPLTVAVARVNLAGRDAAVEQADVIGYPLRGRDAAFCDPARRGNGRRIFDPNAFSPPLGFLSELAAAVPLTGAKVGPGIPHELVPAGAEAEWISEAGEVKEAALWFGPLASTRHRATLLPSGATVTGTGAAIGTGPVGRYLYEPDGAVIRAHLVAEIGGTLQAHLLDPSIAYLSADARQQSPFVTGYEVTEHFGFSLKRLRAVLRERDIGRVTIKKRGSALDPAQLRRQLRLRGTGECTVVLTRVAGNPTVLLCRPLGNSVSPAPAGH